MAAVIASKLPKIGCHFFEAIICTFFDSLKSNSN